MLPEYESLRRLGAFTLGDPDAGRQLIENLDARRVRLQVVEMCWHFGFPFPDDALRRQVKAFLDDLCRRRELVQPAGGLYCRPDMITGNANVNEAAEKLVGLLRDGKTSVRAAKAPAEEKPREPPAAYKKRVRKGRRTKARQALAAEASTVASLVRPKGRPISPLRKQTDFILRWLRANGGRATKADLVAAAGAEGGLIEAVSDLDVAFQRLFNRARLYFSDDGYLKLTRLGEQEAEAIGLWLGPTDPPAPHDA